MIPLNSIAAIWGFTIIAINMCIFLPIGAFATVKFWQQRTAIFIAKRRPIVVIFGIITFYFYMLVYVPLSVFYLIGVPRVSYTVLEALYGMSWLAGFVVLIRVWLLYFDYKRALHVLTSDNLSDSDKNPWTLKHSFLGKPKFLIPLVLIFLFFGEAVISQGVTYFAGLDHDVVQNVISGLYFVVFIAPMFYLAFAMRSFSDDYAIKYEMKLLTILLSILAVIHVFVLMVFTKLSAQRMLLSSVTGSTFFFGATCIWTIGPIWKLQQRQKPCNVDHESSKSLRGLLAFSEGYDAFAEQLVREFSTECLLFLLETVILKKKMQEKKILTEETVGFMIEFPINTLQEKSEKINAFKFEKVIDGIEYIVTNYIDDNDAVCCVNISHTNRSAVIDAWEQMAKFKGSAKLSADGSTSMAYTQSSSMSKDDIAIDVCYARVIEALDVAMKEVFGLLENDSFVRFRKGEKYAQLMQIL